MPVAKIHVREDRYSEQQLSTISSVVHSSLVDVINCPPDDFFQFINVLSRDRFLHTDSYLGLTYSDDFIYLEITFLLGRSKETKLRLLSVLNERIVEKLGINPDDLMTLIHEIPPENCSFGRGVAQRINVVQKP